MRDNGTTVHSVVTDPPYFLESIVKRFGKSEAKGAKFGTDGRFSRSSRRFIGQNWDAADEQGYRIAHDPEFWKLVLDVMLPGAFCLAFSSPKTGHWQACAMEQAGFIAHPFIGWGYATGMPRGHAVTKFEPDATKWHGWYYGTATLKAALEPIYMMQKPFSEKTGYANVLKHGVGAVHVESGRVAGSNNWPANLMHDGSPEITACLAGRAASFNEFRRPIILSGKASAEDRAGSDHPTVKPVALIRQLARLVTPPGGTVLDPFAGSGTTGQAADVEGFDAVLIERDATFAGDIRRRFNLPGNSRALDRYLDAIGTKG